MRIGSLFTGAGGLDMAVEQVTGASPAWFVEFDPNPSKVLARHWPDVPNFGDVTAVNWAQVDPVDILTAGYPCQPFSHAGKRKGSTDDRHLWPYVADAIGALRPRLVVLENVAGHLSLGGSAVVGDLARLGFDARWGVVRASDAGAAHQRKRLFIVAADNTVGAAVREYIDAHRDEINAGVKAALDQPAPDAYPARLQGPQPAQRCDLPTRRTPRHRSATRLRHLPGRHRPLDTRHRSTCTRPHRARQERAATLRPILRVVDGLARRMGHRHRRHLTLGGAENLRQRGRPAASRPRPRPVGSPTVTLNGWLVVQDCVIRLYDRVK